MKAITCSLSLLLLSSLLHAQIHPDGTTAPQANSTPVTVPAAYPSTLQVNSVRSWQLQKPVTDPAQITAAMSATDAQQQTQYMDGLGRPLQVVTKAASPAGKDLVAPVIYDAYGRESMNYLPYVSTTSDGSFQANPFSAQASFMQQQYGGQGEQFFYGNTLFEASPLNRVRTTLAPGNSWVGWGRGINMAYEFNAANEVLIWTIGSAPGSLPLATAYYAAGALTRSVTSDEHNKRVVEYKDKVGQVVLKKVELVNNAAINDYIGWLCTYYVYDDFYRLRFVLSPKAIEETLGSSGTLTLPVSVSQAVTDGLCFRYEYDTRGRMTVKKVPDAGEVYMIYDARDRLSYTQDANMRSKTWWLATLYDQLNRPAMTGMMTYTGTMGQLTTYAADPNNLGGRASITVQGGSTPVAADLVVTQRNSGRSLYQASNSIEFTDGFESEASGEFVAEISDGHRDPFTYYAYGNRVPSGAGFIALTITSYDDYAQTQKTFDNSDNAKLDASNNLYAESLPSTASNATRGLTTGGKVWLMRDPSDLTQGQWLESAAFYDDQAKAIQVQAEHEKGTDVVTSRYDFSGKVLSTYEVHRNTQSTPGVVRVRTTMDYDAQGRLLAVRKQLNDAGSSKLIAQSEYDELGELKTKHLGNGLQDLAYEYNIRGWLKAINKDYVNSGSGDGRFGQTLSYDYGFTDQQFNGNISGLQWRSAGDGEARAYGFTYDNVNRLLKADFTQYTGGWNTTAGVDFSVGGSDASNANALGNIKYDANGNILEMWQKGLKLQNSDFIDKMTYTYMEHSNRLQNVMDYANTNMSGKFGDFQTSALHPQKALKDGQLATPNASTLTNITDYTYDANGNMNKDLNKDIATTANGGGITYNYLNLPVHITFKAQDANNSSNTILKGTISYRYDASGAKHEKIVDEMAVPVRYNGNDYTSEVITTTTYIGNFIYESKEYRNTAVAALNYEDRLQFFADEEGRVRPKDDGNTPFVYDYFIKDHLGNVRMVLTDEQKSDVYPMVSLEDSKLSKEQEYYAIDAGQIVSNPSGITSYTNDNGLGNVPHDATFEAANSQKMYKLNATNAKIGLGMTLKVMAGDHLDIFGKSYYTAANAGGTGGNSLLTVSSILDGLLGAPGSVVGVSTHNSVTSSGLGGLMVTTGAIGNFLTGRPGNDDPNNTVPTAYVNYIFFDEQFHYAGGGFSPVDPNTGTLKDHHSDLQNILVPKNGYVYIYCSNESPVNVFFDNLQVVHTRGPVLEETHYYPFGLTMAGISSKSVGDVENKKKYQQYEFNSDFDINLYESFYRSLDPQLGRFRQQDPKPVYEMEGLYNSMNNNPISNIDILGDITHYYNTDGTLLRSQDDNNGYATITVISDENLSLFATVSALIDGLNAASKKISGKDLFSSNTTANILSTAGISYDTKEYADYYDRHSKDYYTGNAYVPTDGKGKLVNENMAGLKLKGGYLRVMDKLPPQAGNNPETSGTNEIGDRDIHTHTLEGRRFTLHGQAAHVDEGKAAFGGVDGNDLSRGRLSETVGQEKYRSGQFNVVVTPTHVYLYRDGQVVISVDRKGIPSKNPGEIK